MAGCKNGFQMQVAQRNSTMNGKSIGTDLLDKRNSYVILWKQ